MKFKTNIRTATALAVAFSFLLVITGCGEQRSKQRIYTVTAYSTDGKSLGKWEHVTIVTSRGGWCIVALPDGKRVQIDGPHIWVEE